MELNDTVFNKVTNKTGRIVGFMKRHPGALVDYSDRMGVMFRWSNIKNLEVIDEDEQRRI